jgi:hypothetical protein
MEEHVLETGQLIPYKPSTKLIVCCFRILGLVLGQNVLKLERNLIWLFMFH